MRTGRHLSKKETCPRLLEEQITTVVQDNVIGSVYVQFNEQIQIQQGKNHHNTPTTDKCEMTKGQNRVISCKAQALSINILICDMKHHWNQFTPTRKLLLKCFVRRHEGCLRTRAQFPSDYQHFVW